MRGRRCTERFLRCSLRVDQVSHDVLLVRLPHPRSPNRRWDAEELLADQGFLEFITSG